MGCLSTLGLHENVNLGVDVYAICKRLARLQQLLQMTWGILLLSDLSVTLFYFSCGMATLGSHKNDNVGVVVYASASQPDSNSSFEWLEKHCCPIIWMIPTKCALAICKISSASYHAVSGGVVTNPTVPVVWVYSTNPIKCVQCTTLSPHLCQHSVCFFLTATPQYSGTHCARNLFQCRRGFLRCYILSIVVRISS